MNEPKPIEKRTLRDVRLIMAVLFGIVFAVTAFFIQPIIWTLLPASYFYEAHQYTPMNVSVGDDFQEVILNRTVKVTSPGVYVDELILLRDGESATQVFSFSDTVIYEKRTEEFQDTTLLFKLPPNLEPGKYFWQSHIRLDLPRGVNKDIFIQSDHFYVFATEEQ